MWSLVFRNWRLVLGGIGLLSILGGFLYVKHLIHQNAALKQSSRQNMEAYVKCYKTQEQQRIVSNEFHTKTNNLRKQLANAQRLRPQCILPKPSPGHSPAPATGELSGGNGVSTAYLIDFAGRCEETRLKLLGTKKRPRPRGRGSLNIMRTYYDLRS